jgi:hypothetical protein
VRIKAFTIAISVFLVAFCAQALDSTSTLPEGINSPSVRYGTIEGINQRYTQSGSLMNLGDYKSVVFDANNLMKMNEKAKELIDALNRFGSQNLGNDFNMGVLKIDTKPEVKYFAPVYARGITDRWTLGVGLPLVTYTNKISMSQQNSNIDFYRQQFSGLSPELDEALNTNLADAANETLVSKGYKSIQNHKETFLGDTQLVSIYRFYEDDRFAWAYQTTLNLPTGPQYDPDDLAALNVFGRTNVNNELIFSARAGTHFTFAPYMSYLVNLPDHITARVPTNEDDTLPDASTKQSVERQIGNTISLGGNVFYDLNDNFSFGSGYEYAMKERDQYKGSGNGRYDLLAQDTAARAQKIRGQISYSTVKSYFKKTAAIPLILSLQISDTIAGVNVERQLVQELSLMLFF